MGKRKRDEGEAEDVVLTDSEPTEDVPVGEMRDGVFHPPSPPSDAMVDQAPDVMPPPDLAGYQWPEPSPIVGPAGTATKTKTTLLERQILERGEVVTVERMLTEMEKHCESGGSVGLNEVRALLRIAALV